MSNGLLSDIKLKRASADQAQSPVSLEELLIEEIERSAASREVEPESAPVSTEPPKTSRRTRRKRLKTSKVVNRTKFQSSGKETDEQKRKNKEYQERNKKALLKRQKQSNQKNQSGSIDKKLSAVGGIVGKVSRSSQQRSKEVKIKEIRPVIIGSAEYVPIFKRGRRTHSGRVLRLKRAVRRLKIDRQIRISKEVDTTMPPPAAVDLIIEYTRSYKKFIESSDPRSLSMYKDALSAFGLFVDEDSSTTEVLYTLVTEYSKSLSRGTSRLDESADRTIEPGTSLVPSKDEKIEDYYAALSSNTRDPFKKIIDADVTDIELAVKCLTAVLAKEILFSYNIERYGISSNVKRQFRARKRTRALTNPPSRTARIGADCHGLVYTSTRARKAVNNYPFELSDIISRNATNSIPDFINDAVEGSGRTYRGIDKNLDTVQYESPYQATSAGFEYCANYVDSLMSKEDLNFGASAFLGFFVDVLQKVAYVSSGASISSEFAIQLQTLCEAAENKTVFNHLMVYLAFRQEKLSNYDGGEDPDFGPSTVLRKSSTLKKVLKNSVSKGKVTSSFVSKPKDVTVSPSPTDDGQTNFTAPEKTTTTTIEQSPTTGQVGTLESMFDITYEEVCESFAKILTKRFGYNRSSGFSVNSSKTRTFQASFLEDMLKRSTTSSLPLFDLLLSYSDVMEQALPTSKEDDSFSIFSAGDGSRTNFNRLRKDNCFVAFSLLVCKISKLLLKDRLTVTFSGISNHRSRARISYSSNKKSKSSSPVKPYSVKYATDWQSSVNDLRAFVDSSELDSSDIADTYPLIAAVCNALTEEEEFLREFSSSLSDFFTEISDNFDSVTAALNTETDGVTLAKRMKSGFSPSPDMLKLLKSYSYSWNTKDMIYNGVKTRDKTVSWVGFRTLQNELRKLRKKQKIICIGLPSGILQDAKNVPSEIGEIAGFVENVTTEDKFTIVVQKIDQADPDVKYEDKEFVFSRSLFCMGSNPDLRFVKIDDDLNCTVIRKTDAIREYSGEIVENHTTDFILKQYADLQLDVDFNESAFCNSRSYIVKVKKGEIDIPALSNIDITSQNYLTASNLAFDPRKRKMENMRFLKSDGTTINIKKKSTNDIFDYSAFDFTNSYGSIFSPTQEDDRLKEGVTFERTICIPIDDDSFELDLTDIEEDSREVNSELLNRLNSQKAVGLGRETSEGVDLFTYRVSIKVGDE